MPTDVEVRVKPSVFVPDDDDRFVAYLEQKVVASARDLAAMTREKPGPVKDALQIGFKHLLVGVKRFRQGFVRLALADQGG